MAIEVSIDDLNIPAAIKADPDNSAELIQMITDVKSIVLRVTGLEDDNLTDQQELDFESAIALEVTARFFMKETPQDQAASRYGPGELFSSRDAGVLVSIHYSPFVKLI